MPRPGAGPWRREFAGPIQAIQTELNRLFDEYWTPTRFGSAAESPPIDVEPSAWNPSVDLVETPDAYVLTADLPGVDPATIDLSITGNVLTLRGTKPDDHEADHAGFLRERRSGPFHRQIALNGHVNFDRAEAQSRFGVLQVRIPKQEVAQPRTIKVQAS